MTIALIVFSLALHGVTFFLLFLLYQHLQGVKQERRELYGMREDMEELLSRYTEEMKQENEELKNYFDNRQIFRQQVVPEEEKEDVEPEVKKHPQNEERPVSGYGDAAAADTEFLPPEPAAAYKFESSDQARVLSLSSQGYSRDDIAKQLHIGKGEVDLFLKFYQ